MYWATPNAKLTVPTPSIDVSGSSTDSGGRNGSSVTTSVRFS